jgi:hypothetical protein
MRIDELERALKEAAVAQFKASSQYVWSNGGKP